MHPLVYFAVVLPLVLAAMFGTRWLYLKLGNAPKRNW